MNATQEEVAGKLFIKCMHTLAPLPPSVLRTVQITAHLETLAKHLQQLVYNSPVQQVARCSRYCIVNSLH